jgi:Uma2 family endonuclease
MASSPNPAAKLAHVRPVRPLHFPEQEPWEEHLGQSPRHYALCSILHQVLAKLCGEEHGLASDVFVYWDARSPKRCRAPDATVKIGLPASRVREERSWKTWELGVPELVVEVLSLSDTDEKWTLAQKREAYERMGVREFVCFDLDKPEGSRLRVWDRVQGDFVERVVDDERTPCVMLSAALGVDIEWTVAAAGLYPAALRLAREGQLIATLEEDAEMARVTAEQERARAEEERARAEEERTRAEQERNRAEQERTRANEAVARIAALEAKLRALGSSDDD